MGAADEQMLRGAVRLLDALGIDRVMAAALIAHDAECRQCRRSEARCQAGERLARYAAPDTGLTAGYQPI